MTAVKCPRSTLHAALDPYKLHSCTRPWWQHASGLHPVPLLRTRAQPQTSSALVLFVQGVSKSEGLGSKNRIEATLHPDVTFKVT